ncbi:MAG: hypothetical protein AB8B64_25740 [Granulosicoccus sp.]
MSNKHASSGTTTIDSSLASDVRREPVSIDGSAQPGFIRRYRLPLTLAVIAVCLYAGSILYILLGRGQIS